MRRGRRPRPLRLRLLLPPCASDRGAERATRPRGPNHDHNHPTYTTPTPHTRPAAYRAWLDSLRPYTAATRGQRIASVIMLAYACTFVLPAFVLMRLWRKFTGLQRAAKPRQGASPISRYLKVGGWVGGRGGLPGG